MICLTSADGGAQYEPVGLGLGTVVDDIAVEYNKRFIQISQYISDLLSINYIMGFALQTFNTGHYSSLGQGASSQTKAGSIPQSRSA